MDRSPSRSEPERPPPKRRGRANTTVSFRGRHWLHGIILVLQHLVQNDPDGPLGGNPRTASTLSVWQDAASLEHFVWNTVHKRFYDRRAEWYAPTDAVRLVMWWVPEGHRPDIAEAAARLAQLDQNGPGPEAFGWDFLRKGTR